MQNLHILTGTAIGDSTTTAQSAIRIENKPSIRCFRRPRSTYGTLVALTLVIAESRPDEKDMRVRIVMQRLVSGD